MILKYYSKFDVYKTLILNTGFFFQPTNLIIKIFDFYMIPNHSLNHGIRKLCQIKNKVSKKINMLKIISVKIKELLHFRNCT